jgi:Prolipoprotein diacylglyceryl transferase
MLERLRTVFNSHLERMVRAEVQLLRRPWSAFQVCGYTGVVFAVILVMVLAIYLSLALWVMTAIVMAAVITFFGLVMATKIITGEEQIIYYHHEIAVMIVAALLLWLLGQPLLPYLDLTILGIGMFLACGRVGCLMVGCCHGRPNSWGVCYSQEHAAAGFIPYYVGVRLFPIQAVESLWVLGIVIVGTFFVLAGYASGTSLAWYVVTYDLGRFCFEFVRGDPDRPYLWGYSQGQWISVLLMVFVAAAEVSGVLPFHMWHLIATACLVLAMIAVALHRRLQRIMKFQLLHPRHVEEIAQAIELVSSTATEVTAWQVWTVFPKLESIQSEIPVACTSLGVQMSASRIRAAGDSIDHFAISQRDGEMTERTARILARLILQLKRATRPGRVLGGNRGVFHLLIHPSGKGAGAL